MNCCVLFPHGNIIAELSKVRNDLMKDIFSFLKSDSQNNFKFSFSPQICNFAILDFQEVSKNDLSEICKLFVKSKTKPQISKINFDGENFFCKISHPLLKTQSKTNNNFFSYTNSFNLLKLNQTLKVEMEKIQNFDPYFLRVFQIGKIEFEEKQNSNEFNCKILEKKWIKIN